MLLTKSRIPVVAAGMIVLSALVLFSMTGTASAGNASGAIPGSFGDNLSATDKIGWNWESVGTQARVKLFINSTYSGSVYGIEVFVNPTTGDSLKPVLKDLRTSALPKSQVLEFDFTTAAQLTSGTTKVGIHLLDSAGADLSTYGKSESPINTNLLADPTPSGPSLQTTTTVTTTDTAAADITAVAAPTGGASSVIQPSTGGSLNATDGSVKVNIGDASLATTFQIAYDPSPSSVPASGAGINIIKAFDLITYDTAGTKSDITFLKTVSLSTTYTNANIASATNSDPSNFKLIRYNTTTKAWAPLYSTVDFSTRTVTTNTSTTGLYALAAVTPLQQVVLPATGDWMPGSWLILAMGLAGLLMIVAGKKYVLGSPKE